MNSLEGLRDKPGRGRKPILTAAEKEVAKQLIETHPRNPRTVISKLKETTGKLISLSTLKRLAKRFGFIWKRVRKSLKSKRNQAQFEAAQKEIKELKKHAEEGLIELFYFDETGFDLVPSIPYAWQPIGKENTIEIPSTRSKRLNVLGFMNTSNDLIPFIFEGVINTDITIACFEFFSQQERHKPRVIILDQASIHISNEFLGHLSEWEQKGIFLFYLPSYSPELNSIEILWRKIKYDWLPFDAYDGLSSLRQALENILSGYGDTYQINFA